MLAQISDGQLQLGGLFDGLTVKPGKYEKIIDGFSKLTINGNEKYTSLTTGEVYWDKIANSIKGCDEAALSYFKTLDDGNGTINNQSASIEGLSAHLQSTGQSFNFAAIKATMLNTALNAGIFLAASLAIQGIAKVLDNYIHRADNARERTDELFTGFKQMNDTLADHRKTVAELADRYTELSKGVNLSDNKNISLSTDEYEEFLHINEQLADAFP